MTTETTTTLPAYCYTKGYQSLIKAFVDLTREVRRTESPEYRDSMVARRDGMVLGFALAHGADGEDLMSLQRVLRAVAEARLAVERAEQALDEEGLAHDIARNTEPAERVVVQVGWDGRSQPILRYYDELHLPDHMRSIVER